VWDWTTHKLTQSIDLGEDGQIPLMMRFLHDPNESDGYVICGLSSSVFRIYKADVRRSLLPFMLLLLLLALGLIGTHYPCLRAVNTGVQHGCRSTLCSCTRLVDTAREHGLSVLCIEP